jgi:beta-lactam-binding protein with PASTA domain
MCTKEKDPRDAIDLDALESDLDELEGIAECVRLSGYALANPLAAARQGQMEAELARVEKRKGAGDPEVARRRTNLDRATVRFKLLAEEQDRAQAQRPDFDAKTSMVWGRVTDAGVPQEGLTVSAEGDGVRLAFACTDARGSFSMTVRPDTALRLSVRDKDGAELYRDPEDSTLLLGQQLYREIDLTRGGESPCPDPGEPAPPGPETFAMVDLVGQPERTARSVILRLGLKLGTRQTEPAPDKVGLILSHDPAAGTQVSKGDAVDIVVGVAAGVAVPDLAGLALERAQALLKKAGLKLGKVTQVPVTNETPGLILDQSPPASTMVDPGSAVDVSIGVKDDTGPTLVTVPDVKGRNLDEATAVLKEAGLERGAVSEVEGPEDKIGIVVNQSPAAGTRVGKGSAVGLVVGKAKEPEPTEVTVPNVVRLTRKDAKVVLEGAGLVVGEVTTKPVQDALVDIVLDQSPDAGSVVQPGSAVSLIVGERQEEPSGKEVPAVTGRKSEEAQEILRAAGFATRVTQKPVRSDAQVGIVVAQAPTAGTVAQPGSTVTISVGVKLQIPGGGGRPTIDAVVAVAEERPGGRDVKRRLSQAGVSTLPELDRLLATDPREARQLLGFRTVADAEEFQKLLRRARAAAGGG